MTEKLPAAWLLFLTALILAACSTPPQVKALSLRQLEYFDAAIEAVPLQSEASILAAKKLVSPAKLNIASIEQANRERYEKLTIDRLPAWQMTTRHKPRKEC
jgi:uncharacterized protein YcfL